MDFIKKTEMQDADVILYHGKTWLAKAIRFFDGSNINHAGLYLGLEKVGEALANGLTKRSFQESIKDNEYVIIRRLKSHHDTMKPVLEKAKTYISAGNRYAYEQIILLAFLCLTRKLHVNAGLDCLIRKILDEAANMTLLMEQGKKQPMICSEFVYRCYDEALPSSTDPYSLDINPFPRATLTSEKKLSYSGVHRDSLLAWATDVITIKKGASSDLLFSLEDSKSKKKLLEERNLDELIEQYLFEVKGPLRSTFDVEASIRNAEMLASIKNFAEAYYQTSIKGEKEAVEPVTMKIVEGEIPAAFAYLLGTVANFVTPGDFLNCQNLYSVGNVSP
ncbi:MAG: hypothetical protein A2W27_05245 [Deltaproteobacteria bacterium RBG_16_44_11]|nr:MAG: hypothetical protein A2W27_05245 [Deltaproteobacteria bacterium RBG_16_44_11]